MTHNLPTLPEPAGVIIVGTQALRAFTADQMQEYAIQTIESTQLFAMTREQRDEVFLAAEARMADDINLSWRAAIVDSVESHHNIKPEEQA